jgi:hypothetical protein
VKFNVYEAALVPPALTVPMETLKIRADRFISWRREET